MPRIPTGLTSAGGRKKPPPRQRQYLGPILTSGIKARETRHLPITGIVMLFIVGKVEDQRWLVTCSRPHMYQLQGSADPRPHFLVLGPSSWRHSQHPVSAFIRAYSWSLLHYFHQSQGYWKVLCQPCGGPAFPGTKTSQPRNPAVEGTQLQAFSWT